MRLGRLWERLALEGALDVLAEQACIDPVELRLLNIPEEDPEEGLPFSSHKLAECPQGRG